MQSIKTKVTQKTLDCILSIASHEYILQGVQKSCQIQAKYDAYHQQAKLLFVHHLSLAHQQDVVGLQIKSNIVAKQLQLCKTMIQDLSQTD